MIAAVALVLLSLLQKLSATAISLRCKGDRYLQLATLQFACANCLEIWEPEPTGILRVCTGIALPCDSLGYAATVEQSR